MNVVAAIEAAPMDNISPFPRVADEMLPPSRSDVRAAQREWAAGIVEIGEIAQDKGDYIARAYQFVGELYDYRLGPVLFKPMTASTHPFRTTLDEAVSYFVGGEIEEDEGFALKSWRRVRFGPQLMNFTQGGATAMGSCFFQRADTDDEVRVEFTLGYRRDVTGRLRINLHHSSLPFAPQSEKPKSRRAA